MESENIVQQATRAFQAKGAVFLEKRIDSTLITAAHEHFMTHQAGLRREELENQCLKVGHERFMFTLQLSGPFLDPAIYAAPGIVQMIEGLLGKNFIIQSMTVVCAFPGSELQHVHTDYPPLFPELEGFNALCPPYAITAAIPLIDLDESTGTTAMWEGSHRTSRPAENQDDTSDPEKALAGTFMPWAKAGDCYLMDIRLRHAGTPNRSHAPRPILYIVYSRPWFEDRRNFEIQRPLQVSQEGWELIPEIHRPMFKNARRTPESR